MGFLTYTTCEEQVLRTRKSIMPRFPNVRFWAGPLSCAWNDIVRYESTDAENNFYSVCIDKYNPTSLFVVVHAGPFYHRFKVPLPADMDLHKIFNVRHFAYIKRMALARSLLVRKQHHYSPEVKQRFQKQSRYGAENTLVNRHKNLLERIAEVEAQAKRLGTPEEQRGWLRLRRHVVRDPGLISYPVDTLKEIDGKVSWARQSHAPYKRRVVGKMSKLMGMCGISSHVVGDMAQRWNSVHATGHEFEIIEGEDIGTAYTLSYGCSSCMTGDDEYVRLYVENPERVRMVLLKEHGIITGRALLWTLNVGSVDSDEGNVYLDRPYPQDDRRIALYQQWADRNGITYTYAKNPLPYGATVTLRMAPNEAIPYLDTFETMDRDGDVLRLYCDRSGKFDTDCQDGGPWFNGAERVYCVHCDCDMYVDDCEYVIVGYDFVCESCYNDNYCECDSCCSSYWEEHMYNVEGDMLCECCYNSYCAECASCGDVLYTRSLNEHDLCENCAEENEKENA